ncbi:hypothetical protein HHK36_025333 [Tetracentron sinense]|uniref:tRNA-binding domain-containing protein n=1 Tax=Tetracentron sinense TaxID=13715 RepID=A0A834YN06_TETSI|nr:hypothetical protein HHK36_025333 [Tetracentron sinense]
MGFRGDKRQRTTSLASTVASERQMSSQGSSVVCETCGKRHGTAPCFLKTGACFRAEGNSLRPNTHWRVYALIQPDARASNSVIEFYHAIVDFFFERDVKVMHHYEPDPLYVREAEIKENDPIVLGSFLEIYLSMKQWNDKKVVVLANLKPRNMRGVKSSGMLMAASDASHENVELLFPPKGSLPGERIWFGLETEGENQPAAATPNQVQKKKIWELVQPHLKTDNSCVATLGVHPMRTSAGVVFTNLQQQS